MNGGDAPCGSKEERKAALLHYWPARKGGMSPKERLQCYSIGVDRITGPNKAKRPKKRSYALIRKERGDSYFFFSLINPTGN